MTAPGSETPPDLPAVLPAPSLLRRHALAGAAVVGVGVPFLAACGGDDTAADPASAPGSSSTDTPSESPSEGETSESTGGGGALTTAADVPEGGGTILADQEVVVCQPSSGTFTCFSAVCTHQGCLVSSVEDGEIVCGCHNSRFSIEDGSPQSGPATSPLEEVAVTVDGDSITLA